MKDISALSQDCIFWCVDKHKHDLENLILLEEYKFINYSNSFHKDFSKKISISFHVETGYDSYGAHSKAIDEESDLAIYMLQTIRSEGKKLNLFFD